MSSSRKEMCRRWQCVPDHALYADIDNITDSSGEATLGMDAARRSHEIAHETLRFRFAAYGQSGQ